MAKTHVGILEVDQVTSLPNLRSSKGGFGFEGTTPKYWDGTSWSSFSGSGSGVSSWDELYDNDKTLTIDDGTLTMSLTDASADGLTVTGSVGSSGDCIQITNAGTGYDIEGTSGTWFVTKAGAATFVGITMTDDTAITLGATSDATIQWDNANSVLNIAGAVDFDNNITTAANATLTMAGVAGSNILTITAGEAVLSDGSLSITDADNAESVTIINNAATTIGAAASAGVVQIESTSLTTGALLGLQLTEGTLNGGSYIRAWDATAGSGVFTVAESGLTTIAGDAAGTDAFVITAGDLFLSDSDNNIIESEDGTGNVFVIDNKAGVTADDTALLLLDAGGNTASGGNILRIAPTGTPNAGAIGVEYVGAGKTNMAMYIDSDPTGTHVVQIHGGGALTDGKAVLALTNDGNLASGGNLLNVTVGGTPNAAAIAVEIAAASKALTALSVDSDPTASSTAVINGGGALTNGYAVLHVSSDGNLASGGNTFKVTTAGTPASGAMYAEFDFTGITDTNENVGVKIDAGGKKVVGLHVDGDPVVNSLAYFHTDGAIAADKAVVEINGEASADNADSSILRVEQGATDGVANVITLKQDDVSEPFISFETTIDTGNAIQAVAALSLTATHYIMVDIEGVGKRYFAVGTLA